MNEIVIILRSRRSAYLAKPISPKDYCTLVCNGNCLLSEWATKAHTISCSCSSASPTDSACYSDWHFDSSFV